MISRLLRRTFLLVLGASFAAGRAAAASPKESGPARAPVVSVESYVLVFEPGERDVESRVRRALPACPAGTPAGARPCWGMAPFAAGSSLMEIFPVATSEAPASADLAARAWDVAYALRRNTGALRVEPLVVADLRDWERDDLPNAFAAHKDGAKTDCEWSLKEANVFGAWKMLRDAGRKPGEEGASVRIAHPDTGYRQHLETWDLDEMKSPVHFLHGYNYLATADDAMDQLDTCGLIPTPGHGTKSGSVIASPRGRQLPDGDPGECVSGVAPGARLVPLRVSRSVALVSQRNLAKAIFEAAGDERDHVKEATQVISISLGGLPSTPLRDAVRFAERRGLLVVAAAGNYVGTVVWPALYPETIAVAATNVDCGTWFWSSKGPRVDISAPGESVWRAATDRDGKNSVYMGSGTTYATATVAGIAALWLDYHRDDTEIESLRRSGQLTRAFREVLKLGSWKPGQNPPQEPDGFSCKAGGWNSADFGPGIVDARRVLAASVPTLSREEAAESSSELPNFTPLFSPEARASTVRSRYSQLFRARDDREFAEVAELEGEILFLYAIDRRVRAALRPLTARYDPGAPAFANARRTLLSVSISRRLRAALCGGEQRRGPSPE